MWGFTLWLLGLVGLSPTPYIAAAAGTTDPAIKLFISLVMGYPISVFYHKYVRNSPEWRGIPQYRSLFFLLAGVDIAWFNFGAAMCHNAIPALVLYATTAVLGPSHVNVIVTFIVNMGYLLMGYAATESEDYDITWTMPHCVLTLKLIALSFDMWDGTKNPRELSENNKQTVLYRPPTLIELLGFVYFPACFLVGPIFSFKRYLDFVDEKYPLDSARPVYERQACIRMLQGIMYIVAHLVGVSFFDVKHMLSDDFWETSVFYRHIYCGLWAHFALYKYISCWLLTEAACIRIGLSYNGVAADGATRWDACSNIKLMLFETATKFQHYITSFNCNTNHFAAEYIYKRLKFLGNRNASQFCTLLFLAVWHGIRSGYYVTFFNEFIIIVLEKGLEPMLDKLAIYHSMWDSVVGRCVLHCILKFYTIVFMGWSLVPFDLKVVSKWHSVYCSLFYSGFIVFVPWPLYRNALRYCIEALRLRRVKAALCGQPTY